MALYHRRTFLASAATGLAWWLPGQDQRASGRFRIWDIHCHLYSVQGDTPEKRIEVLVRAADRLGIERLILSQGYSSTLHPAPEQFREENDRVMRAIRRFPDRVYGSV